MKCIFILSWFSWWSTDIYTQDYRVCTPIYIAIHHTVSTHTYSYTHDACSSMGQTLILWWYYYLFVYNCLIMSIIAVPDSIKVLPLLLLLLSPFYRGKPNLGAVPWPHRHSLIRVDCPMGIKVEHLYQYSVRSSLYSVDTLAYRWVRTPYCQLHSILVLSSWTLS